MTKVHVSWVNGGSHPLQWQKYMSHECMEVATNCNDKSTCLSIHSWDMYFCQCSRWLPPFTHETCTFVIAVGGYLHSLMRHVLLSLQSVATSIHSWDMYFCQCSRWLPPFTHETCTFVIAVGGVNGGSHRLQWQKYMSHEWMEVATDCNNKSTCLMSEWR
jgi:DNA-binding transcriptional regulator LsrR (DeoR family)